MTTATDTPTAEPGSLQPIRLRMGAGEWGLLLLLSVIWGGSYFFAKVAVAEFPPLTVAWARVAIASVALGLLLAVLGQGLPRGRLLWRDFALMGLMNNVIPFSLIFSAQTQIASALAAILNATTPLFTVLVAHGFTTDEKLNAGKFAGVLLGLAGVAVMIGPGAFAGLDNAVLAELACLGAALSYAFASMVGRRFRSYGITPFQTAFGPLTAASLIMLPIIALAEQPWTMPVPSLKATGAVLALGLLSTAIAYVIFYRLLARAGATNVALVTFLIPPSAILLGVVLLGETLAPAQIAGMALIALGLVAIDGRLLAAIRGRA